MIYTSYFQELRRNREICFDNNVNKIHKFYQILEIEPGNSERNLVCSEAQSIDVLSQDVLDKVERILQGKNENPNAMFRINRSLASV